MEFIYEAHRIYAEAEDGELLAEIDFPEVAPGVVDLNHTFVSDKLRGQGVAGKLMAAAIARIEEQGWKTRTSCSYAKGWMEKHPEKAANLEE